MNQSLQLDQLLSTGLEIGGGVVETHRKAPELDSTENSHWKITRL